MSGTGTGEQEGEESSGEKCFQIHSSQTRRRNDSCGASPCSSSEWCWVRGSWCRGSAPIGCSPGGARPPLVCDINCRIGKRYRHEIIPAPPAWFCHSPRRAFPPGCTVRSKSAVPLTAAAIMRISRCLPPLGLVSTVRHPLPPFTLCCIAALCGIGRRTTLRYRSCLLCWLDCPPPRLWLGFSLFSSSESIWSLNLLLHLSFAADLSTAHISTVYRWFG